MSVLIINYNGNVSNAEQYSAVLMMMAMMMMLMTMMMVVVVVVVRVVVAMTTTFMMMVLVVSACGTHHNWCQHSFEVAVRVSCHPFQCTQTFVNSGCQSFQHIKNQWLLAAVHANAIDILILLNKSLSNGPLNIAAYPSNC